MYTVKKNELCQLINNILLPMEAHYLVCILFSDFSISIFESIPENLKSIKQKSWAKDGKPRNRKVVRVRPSVKCKQQ